MARSQQAVEAEEGSVVKKPKWTTAEALGMVSPPLPSIEERKRTESYPRASTLVTATMTVTTDPELAAKWQKVGAHLVSITKETPSQPMRSKNRYVFRETKDELDALVKQAKEDGWL